MGRPRPALTKNASTNDNIGPLNPGKVKGPSDFLRFAPAPLYNVSAACFEDRSSMPAPPADEPPPSGGESLLAARRQRARALEEISEDGIEKLGEFRILRPLGRGGMAEFYLAEQTSLHRQVAVKVLRPELLSDETILKRFEQEAKSAAGLIHPTSCRSIRSASRTACITSRRNTCRG